MSMLYHASPKAGLTTLYPHVSTHQKPYVYAIDHMVAALLFGARHDDFDFILDEEGPNPVLYECYPDAFQTVYYGKSCSVYEVDGKGFLRNVTSWSPELVCETAVTVQNEIVIPNLYEKLMEEQQLGNLQLYTYEFNDEYRKKISTHIVDRLIRFRMDLKDCLTWEDDTRFSTYYRGIIEALLDIMDGGLLK